MYCKLYRHHRVAYCCVQVADVPPYIAKNPPSLVDGIKIGRSEQHELFNWVRKQLHVRPGLDQGILPPERPYLKSWDAKVHKRLGQLARQIKDKRRSKHETGSGSMGPFGHLANVWGFMNVKKGKSSDYSSETLKEHAQACNTSFISESKLECSSETVQDTILFTVEYARVWSNQPANPYRLHKVLTHALGNTGVGLAGIGEQTGMKLGYVHKGCIYVKIVQPGQGPAHEQLRRHLIKHATHSPHLMQVNVVPTLTVLGSISEQLRSAVKDYKKEERKASNCGQTGQQVLAQDLGWHAASSLQYPSGHWQVH